MELDQQLSKLAKHVAELKNQLAREEGQLETLRRQRDDIIQTCRKRGVDPAELDASITQKERELVTLFSSAEASLGQIEKKRRTVLESFRSEAKVE
jgi:F0F1-type ATP synthase membrane subunit b/b'